MKNNIQFKPNVLTLDMILEALDKVAKSGGKPTVIQPHVSPKEWDLMRKALTEQEPKKPTVRPRNW